MAGLDSGYRISVLLEINVYENLIVPMAFMNTRIRMVY
jgi:hypothetical protein